MLTKKNKIKAPKNTNKEQKRLVRALRLEANLIERLKRLRQTKIFRNNPSVVVITISERTPSRVVPRKVNNRNKTVANRVAVATRPTATSKRQRKYSMIYRSLEDVCERFESYCCECGQQMKVHAHGIGHPIKEEIISASCWNEVCSQRGVEVKFRGAQLQPQDQSELVADAGETLLKLPVPTSTRMSI